MKAVFAQQFFWKYWFVDMRDVKFQNDEQCWSHQKKMLTEPEMDRISYRVSFDCKDISFAMSSLLEKIEKAGAKFVWIYLD